MDAALFTKMLSDKSVLDLKKLGYKYPQADMGEFVSLLKNGFYHPLPGRSLSIWIVSRRCISLPLESC